jgi:hypothetical protein
MAKTAREITRPTRAAYHAEATDARTETRPSVEDFDRE